MKILSGLFFIMLLIQSMAVMAEKAPIAIAIHGGAGTITPEKMTPEREKAIRAKLKESLEAGYAVLQSNGSSLDAVITAIEILEDSPLFNAGIGAVYTHDETHELDASIMRGDTLDAGAIAGVKRIKNPISLARMVMEDSPHVMLSGEGAEVFAEAQGVELVDNSLFNTEFRLNGLRKAQKKTAVLDASNNLSELDTNYKVGTVGAVALDQSGLISAGTSTGGMTNKRFGRIGDAPIIGAGTYADNSACAVSATGHGEYFIRYNVAADICARVKYQNKSIAEAGSEVINTVLKNAGGDGGVIILNQAGDISFQFNTTGMYRGSIDTDGNITVAIYKEQ